MTVILMIAGVVALAFANGANDNFKGVATLFGSATTGYRRALAFATATTFAGSLGAVDLARGLVRTFSGAGLVPDDVAAAPAFAPAVAAGAAATVWLATRLGLPVSTTHALTGALVGAGAVAAGPGAVKIATLGSKFVLPLAVSPLAALALAAVLYPLFRRARLALGVERETCVCVGTEFVPVAALGAGAAAAVAEARTAVVVARGGCVERYRGGVLGLSAQTLLDSLHHISAGAVSFARGLNDTPKIAAILFGASALGTGAAETRFVTFLIAGIAIALGGVLSARRVAETMAHRITPMNAGQGFTANLVTSLLVVFASLHGLPVSTTHVSCGALIGIGAATGGARWRTIGGIVLAWVGTLPLGALLAAAAFGALANG